MALAMPAAPFISFLTDFGAASTAPAVCRGVMLRIAPDARIVDLTHAVRQFAIRDGAFLLWSAVPYLPVGVHLAVVDPGVGTERRAVAIRAARGDLLVGPDNGVLRPAAQRLGGIVEARALTNPALWLGPVSSTFHGRDLFAPVAAHLAAGEPLASVGDEVPVVELLDLVLPSATARDGGLDSAVLFVDAFGNCRLAGELADLEAATGQVEPGRVFRVVPLRGDPVEVPYQPTFGRVAAGAPLLYEDADYAGLGLAVNQGSAAERFGLAPDDRVRVEPA
jgi:S-adenosylmethionine hydrolase